MGLFDAAGNIAGAGISAGASSRQAEKQRQHDIDMAGLNQQNILAQMATSQEYNEENMAIQNQYQIDQWIRENLYNDPSAVAARYRKAGINPRAAFGNGSASGAGIAGGLSSAPSGSSPSGSTTGSSSTLYHSNPLAGLSHLGTDFGNALRAQRSIDADVAQKNAQTGEQLIENEYKEQNLISDLILKRGEYEKLMADKSLSDTQRDHYKKLIEGIDQQIAESKERTKGYEGQRKNVEAQTENTKASTQSTKVATEREQNKLDFEEKFNGAPMELLNTLPGASAFISYSVTKQVESGIEGLKNYVQDVNRHPWRFPDPVGDFVRDNWPKLRDWLNEIDRKFTNDKAKPL